MTTPKMILPTIWSKMTFEAGKELLQRGIRVELFYSVRLAKCLCGKPGCRPGKHPILVDGKRCKIASKKRLKRLLAANPKANIAMVCGVESGILVLDCDIRNGGDKSLKALIKEHGNLPKTVCYKSQGGGKNRVYRYPKLQPGQTIKTRPIAPGVDIVADKGSALIPPSMGINGKYEPITWFTEKAPADLPDWLLTLALGEPSGNQDAPNADADADAAPSLLSGVAAGTRNTQITKTAGKMHRAGLSPDEVLAVCLTQNQSNPDPLTEKEVKEAVASITKRDGYMETLNVGDPADVLVERLLTEFFAGGAHLVWVNGPGFYCFNGIYWEVISDMAIKHLLNKLIDRVPASSRPKKQYLLGPALDVLRTDRALPEAKQLLDPEDDPIFNCQNGEVHLTAAGKPVLKPHDPKSFLTDVLPIEYDQDAKAPRYEQALMEIFANSSSPEEFSQLANQIGGLIISGWRKTPYILIFKGRGGNGKSFLARLITDITGANRVYSGSVSDLSDKFATGDLVGKKLFVDDDVSSNAYLPENMLKKMSEEKIMYAEEKYKPKYAFKCRSLPLLLCNHNPRLRDTDLSVTRRLVVVPFDRQFGPTERDPYLGNYIMANEAAGVLNLWLNGFQSVLRKRKLMLPKGVDEANTMLINQANPVTAFVEQCCIKQDGATPVKELYDAFKAWVVEQGVQSRDHVTAQRMREDLEGLGYKTFEGSGRARMVKGLALRSFQPRGVYAARDSSPPCQGGGVG